MLNNIKLVPVIKKKLDATSNIEIGYYYWNCQQDIWKLLVNFRYLYGILWDTKL